MSTTYVDSEGSMARHSQRASASSTKRFRDSNHLVPTPGEYKLATRYKSFNLSLPIIIITPLLMMAAGVGLEVALAISGKNGGFAVPARNVLQVASTQFLLSFFPTILIYPLGLVWRELDWYIRWYQPYVVLSQGNAKAEVSLLLDYIALGPVLSLLYSLRFKHRIIFWSSLTALATYILHPLAGSIFQVQQRPQTGATTATIINTIGLIQDFDQLNAFAAAAGFAEAAVFNNLTDPPFIRNGWATAEFVFPTYSGFNGSMTVNTTGIQTTPNCENSAAQPSIVPNGTNLTISATSVEGCNVNISFNPNVSSQQYGVTNTGCGPTATLNITQQAVMFWYYHVKADNSNEARAVFCSPSIQAFDVTAAADLATGALTNVIPIDTYPAPNNVTGNPIDSQPFNAVVFEPNSNPFIQARATATNNGVPGAIFRFATQKGLQSTFDLPNGFLDLTTQVYRQHLSLVAKTVYFVGANNTASAMQTSYVPRLWINPLPGHAMALIMIFVGLLGIFVTIFNYRQRRGLIVATPPGSIASSVALTAHSGFGDLLFPYDNEETIERKLRGLRFRLDKRTGAIVADEYILDDQKDETMMSLLGSSQSHMYKAVSTTGLERSSTTVSSKYPPSSATLHEPKSPLSMGGFKSLPKTVEEE